jgi:SAM-dependent methyltransferase
MLNKNFHIRNKLFFLDLSKLELLDSNNNKFLFKSKAINFNYNYGKDYQLGGQNNYFDNLSAGGYRRDGKFTERTWKFLLKHFIVTKKIFEKTEKNKSVSILDIGCSSGFLSRILGANIKKKEDIIYTGIDLSENKLKTALFNKNKIPSVYIWHNAAKKLPIKSKFFDFVVSFQMIKYLPKKEVKKLLREIFRVLKKDGLLFISSDPIFNNRADCLKYDKKELKRKGYKSFWRQQEILETLKDVGFKENSFFGAEINYGRITDISNKNLIDSFHELFPEEFLEALFGFLYPELSITKLIISKK